MKFLSIVLIMTLPLLALGQINVDNELTIRLKSKNLTSLVANNTPNTEVSIRRLDYNIISSTSFKLDEKNLIQLPDTYAEEVKALTNCTGTQRGWTETFNLKVENGYSIRFTESIETKKTLQVNAGIEYSVLKLSGSTSNDITISNSKQQDIQKTVSTDYSKTIQTTLEPRERLYAKGTSITKNVRVPFSCKIILDGDIDFDINLIVPCRNITRLPGSHCIQLLSTVTKKLSDILTEDERTFYIKGFLQNATSSNLTVTYASQILTQQQCDAVYNTMPISSSEHLSLLSSIINDRHLTKANKITVSKIEAGSSYFLTNSVTVPKSEYDKINFNLAIEDYQDKITITTANVVAKIEVQHWSFGPGFCNVISRSGTDQVGINAPPFTWSGWQTIKNHIGEITTTIVDDVNCDTGVKSQVRYYKK